MERRTTKSTNIQYVDTEGVCHEIQFDTHDENELALLWWEFCKEDDLITVIKGIADYESGLMLEYLD